MAQKKWGDIMIWFVKVGTVCLVLALLGLSIWNYPRQYPRELDRERLNELRAVAQALALYRLDGHELPILPQPVIMSTVPCEEYCSALDQTLACERFDQMLAPGYLAEIHFDPKRLTGEATGYYARSEV